MDIKLLRYFVAVVDEGSLHAAARVLGIAQPALSRRIRDLEASVGGLLFDRGPRGATPNQAGRLLHRRAARILDLVAETSRLVRSVKRARDGEVRLGLVRSARKYAFVHKALAQLAEESPEVAVRMVTDRSPRLVADLQDGRLDMVLTYEHGADRDSCAQLLVHRERYVAAIHPKHDLARPGPVTLAELASRHFVWLLRGDDLRAYDPLLEDCRANGLDPLIDQAVRTHGEMIDIVATGGGLCLTPASTMMTVPAGLLLFRSVPELTLELDVFLSWRRSGAVAGLEPLRDAVQAAIARHRAEIASGRAWWIMLDGAPQGSAA